MVRDVIFHYGERHDSSDRFSEVSDAFPEMRATESAAFPQVPGALNGLLGAANSEPVQSDDAFQVRVQWPDDAHGLPVVIYLPGGGFMTGSGSVRWFTSPRLVDEGRIVLVTVTYRVGALGHLGHQGDPRDSQRGLRDICQAIRWVFAHLEEFGGDAARVTLAGDSAGAWYAYALATMPELAGCFARATLISLPRQAPLSEQEYRERWGSICAELPTSIGAASAAQVLTAQTAFTRRRGGAGPALMPAVGGPIAVDVHDFARSAPRLHVRELQLLSTADEASAFLSGVPEEAITAGAVEDLCASLFHDPDAVIDALGESRPGASPKGLMIGALTWHQFTLAHRDIANAASIPVSLAGFRVPSAAADGMSPHCLPLPFLLGNRDEWHDAPMLDGISAQTFDRVSQELRRWFTEFVHAGLASDDPLTRTFPPQRLDFDEHCTQWNRPEEFTLVGSAPHPPLR